MYNLSTRYHTRHVNTPPSQTSPLLAYGIYIYTQLQLLLLLYTAAFSGRHGVGTCDHWCGGDGSETCGGRDAFDVYAMELPEPPLRAGYLDCFKDVKKDRVLARKIVAKDMDPDVSSSVYILGIYK